ncbi:hypothetical protein BDV98DRAFT_595059 [Pterulicium gracile]|uniref:Glucose-methanol-choline oxidoreductase N-terminal domain-containing protein n=1 Tax=Pterulicium gracile TaxID=1884261 RepID=A0A5C3QCA5_9AGAR|nr:hypothetical protein BDV98DRAFT_595059 [Pterula gracilis]
MSAEYDLIFVGGALAACVTTTRLASDYTNLKILIVESGPHTDTLPHSFIPGLYVSNLAPGTTTMKFHASNPAEHLGGRVAVVPTGRGLGGGSAVNSMIYARGSASDFDEWKSTYKNSGWGSKDLISFMQNLETYQPAPGALNHGSNGSLKASIGNTTQFGLDALETFEKYDSTRGSTSDTNDLNTVDKWALWPKWIDETTGRRSDAASAFLYPLLKTNKNVVVSVESDVIRVLFDGTRATGVEYTRAGETLTAKASRLVVISAGTFGSSAVLERSGIGSPEILKAAGVDVLVDLPGVGADYQDHSLIVQAMYLDDAADTLDFAHGGDAAQIAAHTEKWHATGGKGMLATNGVEVGIKYKPSKEEVTSLSPEFQQFWGEKFATKTDKALAVIVGTAGLLGPHGFPPNAKLSMWCSMLLYPESHGHLHIRTKNVNDPLDLDCGFLRSPLDLEALRHTYKRTREYARRHPMYRGEVQPLHPAFPPSSKVTVALPPQTPVPVDAPDFAYTDEEDRLIDEFVGKIVSTTWHSMSTCAMKPRAQGGVVDANLNVYGTKGLKVADLSICPSNVGANTASTAGLIGEKAAFIIAQELGMTGPFQMLHTFGMLGP